MRIHSKTNLTLFALPFCLSLSTSAWALLPAPDQCESDDDCGEGSLCEKSYYVNGCDAESECDSTVHESEFGQCVVQPITCETDSDCGEYLGCISSDSGSCWANSSGESGCTEPDENAPKYCSPVAHDCEVDSDCPREFTCVSRTVCPDIACADRAGCDYSCSTTAGQCEPKEVECDDDSTCPSDWSCIKTLQYACSGGGGSTTEPVPGRDDGGVADTDAASGDAEERVDPDYEDGAEYDPPPDCNAYESVGYCQPNVWEGYYYASAGDDRGDSATGGPAVEQESDDEAKGTNDTKTDNDSSDGSKSEKLADSNGCSVATRGPSAPSAWAWLLLLGLPLVRRRRAVE